MASDDRPSVEVPMNDIRLVPSSSDRTKKLRRHLVTLLFASQATPGGPRARANAPGTPALSAHKANVATAACSLCNGFCCKNGREEAFLNVATVVRVRHANPELSGEELMQLYFQQVPGQAHEDFSHLPWRSGLLVGQVVAVGPLQQLLLPRPRCLFEK